MIVMMVLSALSAVAFAEPTLVGDGVHDDTAAIQAMLDSGRSLVYLPPPAKEYLISKTLKIGSNTELKLDRFTRIRLAPNSDCPMIENRDFFYGTNVNIVVSGGVWDFDNAHQEPCPFDEFTVNRPAPSRPKRGFPHDNEGILMRFSGIRNFTAKGLTLRNPTTYAFTLDHATQFVVEHITFDYDSWNPRPLCMDGIHLDSNCHFGRIAHLRGRTFDDMVALLAQDRRYRGPITDIVIEDICVEEPAFRAVRLLSRSPHSPVKRIVIRDIRGRFYTDVIGFTRYWAGGDERGLIDDVLVENVCASRVPYPEFVARALKRDQKNGSPLFQFQGGVDVGRVVFRNIVRDETDIGTPTFWFNEPSHVREFVLRDVKMNNRTSKAIAFFDGKGKVDKIVCDNVTFEGAWSDTERGQTEPKLSVFGCHVVEMAQQRKVPLEEAVRALRSWGIDGVDLWYQKRDMESNAKLLAAGLKPASLIYFADLAHTNNVTRNAAAIAYAREVGAPRIMLVPGFRAKGEDRADAWAAMKPNLADFLRCAGEAGVEVDFEDFDSEDAVVGSQAHLAEAFAAFPTLGHVLDTGNYVFWKDDVLAAQQVFASRIRHVHIKDRDAVDPAKSVPAGTGTIPVNEVVSRLKKAGYPGWITIECFGSTNMWEAVRTSATFLNSVIREGFANPVLRKSFADPTFWLGDDGWYYGVASGLTTIHRSRNLVDWEDTGVKPIDGVELDELKRFSKNFWAPDAVRIGKTHYLYFTQFYSSDTNRLVCATSERPGGPFKVRSIVMENWRYGKKDCAIDAEVVADGEKLWLFTGSVAGGVWRTRLTPDGLKVDPSVPLEHVAGLVPKRDWRPWVYTHRCYEGSYLYRRDKWWYLFVSCGAIYDGSYRLFVGRSETLDGVFRDRLGVPMTESGGNPLLVTDPDSDFSGPGHNGDIFTDATGRTYMFVHSQWKGLSRKAAGVKWRSGTRCTSLQEIHWDADGWPYFETGSLLPYERRPVMK